MYEINDYIVDNQKSSCHFSLVTILEIAYVNHFFHCKIHTLFDYCILNCKIEV